jgi:hypothetical protein
MDDKQGRSQQRIAIIAGVFVLIGALLGGIFTLLNTLLQHQLSQSTPNIAVATTTTSPLVTATLQASVPSTASPGVTSEFNTIFGAIVLTLTILIVAGSLGRWRYRFMNLGLAILRFLWNMLTIFVLILFYIGLTAAFIGAPIAIFISSLFGTPIQSDRSFDYGVFIGPIVGLIIIGALLYAERHWYSPKQ